MFTATQPIRDIVAELISAPAILARFEIDSSQYADQNLEQACSVAQLSVEQILERLEEAAMRQSGAARPDPTQFTLTRLIQYIVRVHHRYLREQLPQLIELSRGAAMRSRGESETWSHITILLNKIRTRLVMHFEKEEQILFPYIAQLDDDPRLACLPSCSSFNSVAEPVFVMAQEHEFVENVLREIETILPDLHGSAAQQEFADAFRALKNDLGTHVHLEDYCLFPRAIGAERASNQGR
jgi:regulator of cell morphogenesis and NO signaling